MSRYKVNRPSKKGGWICDICNEFFRTKRELAKHKIELNHMKQYGTDFQPKKQPGGICNFCGKILKYKEHLSRHIRYCKKNPNKEIYIGHKHSEEQKKEISKRRIKFLQENPDKHPWTYHNKFISEPCEKLKDLLNKNGYKFESEFKPLKNRQFSIDIAFPNKKLGIEVNGNQHYEDLSCMKLSSYYENRHNLIEENGWKLLELHYTRCFDLNILEVISLFVNGPVSQRSSKPSLIE